MTDLHHHLLYGVDDGPKTAQEMHDMIERSAQQGVTCIAATPHACPGFRPFDMHKYNERLEEARRYCAARSLDLRILSGAEIAWTYQTAEALRQGALPTLNGSEYVLIELWPDISWNEVYSAVSQVLAAGFIPILAHVERYRCFVWNPHKAQALKDAFEVYYQINASSLLGGGGPVFRRFVAKMLRERMADLIASDAHNCTTRAQRLEEAYRAVETKYGRAYADALTHFQGVTG